MSEVKHTPGPWIWGDEHRGLYGCGPNNEVLNYARYEGMWVGFGEVGTANARLIAAAPEMLEALELVLEMGWTTPRKPGVPDLLRDVIEAAISKAKGEK